MCDRKLSSILLLCLLCAAFSYEEDSSGLNVDAELTSENDNSTKSIVYQAINCVSDDDCLNLGKCETRNDGKFCDCKNGTSGDFCETVDDCAEELETCGSSDNVSCVFEPDLEKAVCKCDNETKTYVSPENRCMRNCVSDVDCLNLGKCETRDEGKFCDCKNGTSGDFCETVDDCAEELETCGSSDDVSCVFDSDLEKAVCKCDNETKTYASREKRCISPCISHYQCGRHGYCLRKIGNQKFCACIIGAIGEYCEIIEKCHTKEVDCGLDNNATCTLGENGEVFCQCDDPALGFYYDEKVCKDCAGCGEMSYEGCEYHGSKRICYCFSRYYSTDEGTCEDCKCGYNSYGCSFENETKICNCFGGSSQNGSICEKCDCGPGQSICEFVDDKKVCICKEGYVTDGDEGNCREMCNDTVPCQNGGECVQSFCVCLNGTRGDLCETVEYCTGDKCGKGSECIYNVTSQVAYCKCKDPKQVFDDYHDYCRECDCGTGMRSCRYENGIKTCSCNIPYANQYGQCKLCKCKSHSNPDVCHFKYYDVVCQCDEGYLQYEDNCIKCDCGEYGNCSLNYWGMNVCKCDKGYVADKGTCKKCDCGTNGNCGFDYDGKKTCNCNSGYQEYGGTCTECDCGVNAVCKLSSFGKKQCTCRSGYAMQNGECTACNCYPGTNCTFDGFFSKKCICPERYADNGGTCEDCDCRVKGANCSFASVVNTCQCPEGYEQVSFSSRFLRNYCDDINECKHLYTCPPSTDCVNTIGSYDCVCKDGYEEYDLYDMKKDGCRDIDECVRNWNPCNSPYARCVNTPGSYSCVCYEGYILFQSYEEKQNTCIPETRPWRTATIVVGVFSGVIIAALILAVIGRRYRIK